MSLRTDIMGIFAVLTLSGISQLIIVSPPGSLRSVVPHFIALMWAISLVFFGALGLLATLLSKSKQIFGMAIEAFCRAALGISALIYAIGLFEARGWHYASFAIMTYTGLALLLLVGAVQIVRWLLKQRRAVREVLGE